MHLKSASRNLHRVTGSIKKLRGIRQAVGSRLGQSYRVGRIKREAILRAAEATLIAHGHARFTVERVAARLKISPGNLNYYFPTKASLLEALISYVLVQYRFRVRSAMQGNDTPYKTLGDSLRWLVNDAASERTSRLFRELWAIALHDPQVAKAMDAFYTRSARAYLRSSVAKSAATREVADLEAIVYLILVLSEGTTVLFGTRTGSRDLFERVRETACRAIMHLLTPAARASSPTNDD